MDLRTWWENIRGRRKAGEGAALKGEAVPFPRGVGMQGEGAWQVPGGRGLLWFGQNIEGYDRFDADPYLSLRPSDNSIVAACLSWITTSWSTTPLLVGTMNGGQFEPSATRHPLQDLMERPHRDYTGGWLIAAWLHDLFDWGNFYGNVVTAGLSGPPTEIQLLPAERTWPLPSSDATQLIGGYQYRPDSTPLTLDPGQVLHGRYGVDPTNPRLGRKPLWSARREIWTDNEASQVAGAMMRRPIPSGILSPESASGAEQATEEDLRITKRSVQEASSRENAGGVVAFPIPIKWQQLAFNPKDLALDEARRKPEERVCALFGIPPVVVGLGAGLDRSTYNNMAEARLMAWQDCMIPLQDYVAELFTEMLLSRYPGSKNLVCRWDRSEVGVLQPDKIKERGVALQELLAGAITVNEYRASIGMAKVDGGDERKPISSPPPVPFGGNGANGNGNGTGGAKDYSLPPFPIRT